MKEKVDSQLALNSMRRASRQAVERAAGLDLSIPIWKDGKLTFVKAKDKLEKLRAADSERFRSRSGHLKCPE